jgi:hypothetical protein
MSNLEDAPTEYGGDCRVRLPAIVQLHAIRPAGAPRHSTL